jgi:hypothetical protein
MDLIEVGLPQPNLSHPSVMAALSRDSPLVSMQIFRITHHHFFPLSKGGR